MADPSYLLPCDQCRNSIPLQPRQAGQNVTCPQCDWAQEAPRLGQLKLLPQAQRESGTTDSRGDGSMLRRWLFTVGLASAVFLGAAGVGIYQYAGSIQREIDTDGAVAAYESDIQGLTDAEVYQVAAGYQSDASIGEYYQPATIKSNKQGEILKSIAYGMLAIAGVGVLALISSFFVK